MMEVTILVLARIPTGGLQAEVEDLPKAREVEEVVEVGAVLKDEKEVAIETAKI